MQNLSFPHALCSLSDENEEALQIPDVFGEGSVRNFQRIVIRNDITDYYPPLANVLFHFSALRHLVLERVWLPVYVNGVDFWDGLPPGIETVDLIYCSGDFYGAFDLRDFLANGRWPSLLRLRVQPEDRLEFGKDEQVFDNLRDGTGLEEALEYFGLDVAHDVSAFDDSDFTWPATGVVDAIQDLSLQRTPGSYFDAVERATDDIRYMLGNRGVDVGSDHSYFFFRPYFKSVARWKGNLVTARPQMTVCYSH